MPKRVELIEKKEIFNKYIFTIEQAQLRHEKYDGTMSEPITRLNLDRGDSVAAILHNRTDDTFLFTEQFRYPTYEKGPGWLLEIVAGMIDHDEDPANAMRREITEEVGYSVMALKKISTFYLSPGGTSERIHLFYASIQDTDKVADGGGVAHEGEDIRTLILPVADVMRKMENDEITDAKSLIGLQWFQLNQDNLP